MEFFSFCTSWGFSLEDLVAPTSAVIDCNQLNTPRLTLSYSSSLKCERPSIGSVLFVCPGLQ